MLMRARRSRRDSERYVTQKQIRLHTSTCVTNLAAVIRLARPACQDGTICRKERRQPPSLLMAMPPPRAHGGQRPRRSSLMMPSHAPPPRFAVCYGYLRRRAERRRWRYSCCFTPYAASSRCRAGSMPMFFTTPPPPPRRACYHVMPAAAVFIRPLRGAETQRRELRGAMAPRRVHGYRLRDYAIFRVALMPPYAMVVLRGGAVGRQALQ